MVNGHSGAFDFFEKEFINFSLGQGLGQVQAQPGFQAQPGLQEAQVHILLGIQLFGLKTTSHGKADLKKFIFDVRFTM